MVTRRIGLTDVRQGKAPPRLRLLAPIRYLQIDHPEKRRYDFKLPALITIVSFFVFVLLHPSPPIFGESGLLRFTRDFLIMAVPFMVGALATVSMGSPGQHLDRRPLGAELMLDGEILTLRQFTCYLLGYLCFLGMVALITVVVAGLLKDTVLFWTKDLPLVARYVRLGGIAVVFALLSMLVITVFWALYFLTDVVNRGAKMPPTPGATSLDKSK